MLKRLLALAVAMPFVAAGVAPAAADTVESCKAVPGSTTGFTVGAAGKAVRVPAIGNIAICVQDEDNVTQNGIVTTQVRSGCGQVCLNVVTAYYHWHVSYVVRYTADGVPASIRVPGPEVSSEPVQPMCLFGIGSPADTSCLAYLNVG
ncbi:MAG TPA: hypothetical protein VGX28_10610 [Frankiaceae bacterium]|jgi:hypothetical protein|nr:hypothetical protein [Frankiaceae bacterium]